MIDLSTTYLGLQLKNPIMPGASPLVDDLDQVKRLEDAGSAAIVMHSLFEEQIEVEQELHHHLDSHEEAFGEATSFFPHPSDFRLGPDQYLEQIRKIRECVEVPVIASLNGSTQGGWIRYAKLMEQAGAHALELNTYLVAADSKKTGADIENEIEVLVRAVKKSVKIPVAVKLSPFFTSLPHFASKLDQVPVDGLILFNRFYQPDIDVKELSVVRSLHLSHPNELLLRLHGLAVVYGHVNASLAVSGGVHSGLGTIKALMSGASAVQSVSSLLVHGAEHVTTMLSEVSDWMTENEYSSIAQMIGCMSLKKCPDPRAFERLNYMEILQSWKSN